MVITTYGLTQAIAGNYNLTGYTVENISAGWFVRTSQGTSAEADVVTSMGISSLDKGDIKIQSIETTAAIMSSTIGIALEDIPSGSYGTFATEGIFIVKTGEAIEGGAPITALESAANASSKNVVMFCTPGEIMSGAQIGRALTSASAAGKFIVAKLNFT